ncbi:MAG TPA: GNAT family N-acetyltransferase [Terracidiphilus sp.]
MIVIRTCEGHDELEACVQLQVETWGYDATDIIPRKAFLVMQKVGGQVLGAFDTELPGAPETGNAATMVGFSLSLPGIKTGSHAPDGKPYPYIHSHMLAVKSDYRNRGLGAQLKLAQRTDALTRGITHIEWTFDPVEIKNAFLNIRKLGAVIRRYSENFYGVSSSRLQGGLPTDRLIAEWELDSLRVKGILEGKPPVDLVIEERVCVPASIYQWKASEEERPRALAVQLENRQKFQRAFARGLAVIGFQRDTQGNGIYELGPVDQPGLGI